MKKHLFVLSLIIYVLIGCYILYSYNPLTTVSANNLLYGKILTNNCMLLKTPNKIDDYTNSYFLLEQSYFVKVIEEYDNYYYVNYLDISGYVNKKDIELTDSQISSPYLQNITFDIIKNCFLYSEPKNNENSKAINLTKQSNIQYLGKIYGDELSKNSGNVWYYCKLENNNQIIYGYIHSSNTNNLSPITQNNEYYLKFVNKPEVNNLLSLNITNQTIIIITISLPILFLVFLLLKGFKKV